MVVGQILHLLVRDLRQTFLAETKGAAPESRQSLQILTAVLVIDIDALATLDDERGIGFALGQVGEGIEAANGDQVTVHYTGWLIDGTKFDSSLDRGKPFTFELGARQVIQGWDSGVRGMQVGGIRKLTIPPELAYGDRAVGGGLIPANSTLVFEVKLLEITR